MNKTGLIFILMLPVLLLAPLAAKALCSWVPSKNCQIVGDGWVHATSYDFCNDAQGFSNRRGEDRSCCCGPDDEVIGCCQSKDFAAFVGNKAKCDQFKGSFFPPYPVFYTSTNVCVKNDAECFWTLNNKCEDIGSWQDTSGAKCVGKKKPLGSTVKCCCGKTVPKPSTPAEKPAGQLPTDNKTDQQTPGTQTSGGLTLPNPLGTVSIPTIIGRIIKALLSIVGALALIMFVYGGFTWMTAAGNEARVEKGRNVLIWAAVGLVIVFSAWILVGFLLEALGVT